MKKIQLLVVSSDVTFVKKTLKYMSVGLKREM